MNPSEKTHSLSIQIRRRWFLALAVCITLTPNIYVYNYPGVRTEQFLVILAALSVFGAWLNNTPVKVRWSLFPKLLLGFSVVMVVAILNGYRAGVPVIINDFYEIYKVVMAVGIFLIAFNVLHIPREKDWGIWVLHGLIVVTALISVTQFFNLGGLNAWYVPYIAPTQYKALMEGYTWPRVVGLTGNPNRYAYMAAVGALLGVVLAFRRRNPLYILTGMLCLTAMLMTRSRTGFIFFGVLLAVWILAEYGHRLYWGLRGAGFLLITTVGVVALLFALLYLFPDSLTWRLKELFNLAESRSWQIRLRVWTEYFWIFMDHPLLGSGPAKAQPFRLPVDNEWLYLAKRYGLLGTSYLVAAFVLPLNQAWDFMQRDPAGSVYLALLMGTAVFMIPAGVFHNFQSMALLMLTAGMAFGGWRGK